MITQKHTLKIKTFLIKYKLRKTFVGLKKLHAIVFEKIHPMNFILNLGKIISYKHSLSRFRNIHKGENCFILGSSPSINKIDLSRFEKEVVFTVNKGHLLEKKGLKKSNYHVIIDKNCNDEISKNDLNFSDQYLYSLNIVPKNRNFIFFKKKGELKFQENITEHIYNFYTVVSPVIQIAKYMGFKNIYLLGIDLSFNNKKSHFYNDSTGEKIRTVNHSIVNSKEMLKWIQMSSNYLESKGINLINLSPIKNSLPGIKKSLFNNVVISKLQKPTER